MRSALFSSPESRAEQTSSAVHQQSGIGILAVCARVDRELQELIPVETDLNVLHLTDWDDTTEYVRKEGLAIYVNPSPYPRG